MILCESTGSEVRHVDRCICKMRNASASMISVLADDFVEVVLGVSIELVATESAQFITI